MNYIFSKSENPVNFLLAQYALLRRETNLLWRKNSILEKIQSLELKQLKRALVIHFLEDLEVLHYHRKTAFSSIRNDFMIPFGFAKIFLLHKKWKILFSHENFSHVPKFQIVSLLLIGLLITSFAVSSDLALSLMVLWSFINVDFFRFILKRKSIIYVFKAVIWTLFDQLIMLLGIFFGFLFNLGLIFKKH